MNKHLFAHYRAILRNQADPMGGDGGGGAPPADPPPVELPPLIGEDLSFSEGWQQRVGEHAEGMTFKSLSDMAKSTKEAQRTITQLNQEKADLTKKLEENAPAPKVLPENAEAFKKELKLPDLPEGVTLDDAILDQGIEYALEKGYGPQELSDFLAFDIKRAELEAEAEKNAVFARIGEAKKAIVDQVGEQNYDTTIDNAKFVSQTLGLPLEADDLVNQPNMVIALSKLKDALSEGTLKGASVGGVEISNGGKLAQAEAIVSDPNNPLYKAFHDPSHPQYEQAQTQHARLITESAS